MVPIGKLLQSWVPLCHQETFDVSMLPQLLYVPLKFFKTLSLRAGKIAQWVRALAALPEYLSLIPSTHIR